MPRIPCLKEVWPVLQCRRVAKLLVQAQVLLEVALPAQRVLPEHLRIRSLRLALRSSLPSRS